MRKNKNINKDITPKQALDIFRESGYVIILTKGTSIKEPFTSKIDGELINMEVAFSTKSNDLDFIKKCYTDGYMKLED